MKKESLSEWVESHDEGMIFNEGDNDDAVEKVDCFICGNEIQDGEETEWYLHKLCHSKCVKEDIADKLGEKFIAKKLNK